MTALQGQATGFSFKCEMTDEVNIDLRTTRFRYCGASTVTGIWAGWSSVLIPAGESGFSLLWTLSPDWVFGQCSTLVHGYCGLFPIGYSGLGATGHPPSFPLCLHGLYRHKFTFYILYSVAWIGTICLFPSRECSETSTWFIADTFKLFFSLCHQERSRKSAENDTEWDTLAPALCW